MTPAAAVPAAHHSRPGPLGRRHAERAFGLSQHGGANLFVARPVAVELHRRGNRLVGAELAVEVERDQAVVPATRACHDRAGDCADEPEPGHPGSKRPLSQAPSRCRSHRPDAQAKRQAADDAPDR
jgi:hypothetical protein